MLLITMQHIVNRAGARCNPLFQLTSQILDRKSAQGAGRLTFPPGNLRGCLLEFNVTKRLLKLLNRLLSRHGNQSLPPQGIGLPGQRGRFHRPSFRKQA